VNTTIIKTKHRR